MESMAVARDLVRDVIGWEEVQFVRCGEMEGIFVYGLIKVSL